MFWTAMVEYWYVTAPIAVGVVVACVVLVLRLWPRIRVQGITFLGVQITLADRGPAAIPIFPKSDGHEFVAVAEGLLGKAKKIVLIGAGLNLIQRDPIFLDLARRAARGDCQVEIYMANPWAPDVLTRLIEEETGMPKPPVGQRGLILKLETILDTLRKLGSPHGFRLRLTSNYPTFAMGILDDHYIFYPYGYALLGNFSPVLQFTRGVQRDQPMIEFLDHQHKRVQDAAVDAELMFDLQNKKPVDPGRLEAVAVYIVPPADTPLYQFGSTVLGYDVRERRRRDSQWAAQAGAASQFGFHLTIADALYFASQAEVDLLCRELEFLAAGFRAFTLTDLTVAAPFPDDHSIAIRCGDPSGSLQALHYEMVRTAYRRAVASNYTLGLAGRRYLAEPGAELMLQRHRAPYILNLFRPHFSLLTAAEPARLAGTADELRAFFDEAVPDHQIDVASIAVMVRPSPTSPWQIDREIPLALR